MRASSLAPKCNVQTETVGYILRYCSCFRERMLVARESDATDGSKARKIFALRNRQTKPATALHHDAVVTRTNAALTYTART